MHEKLCDLQSFKAHSLNRSPEITSLNVHVTMCLMPNSTRINVNVSRVNVRVSCVVHVRRCCPLKHLKSVTYKDEIQSGRPV